MATVNEVDVLTEFSIEQKKANIQKCVDDGVLDAQVAKGILADLDKAMSRAGSSMEEITPTLLMSTPVCKDEDMKEKNVRNGKVWEKTYIKSVKGGYVLLKHLDGEEKYSCYPPISMVLEILNNADSIKSALVKKVESGHLFKTLRTRRVSELKPMTAQDITG